MAEKVESGNFDSPQGFAREFSLPLSYAKKLHTRLDTNLALWDNFEAKVLPLSWLFQSALSSVYQPDDSLVQIVLMGCGTQGASEAWAATIASIRLRTQGLDIRTSSIGIDLNLNSILDSRQASALLSQTPALVETGSQRFMVGDGGDIMWTEEISPNHPLVILMRHPDNIHFSESYQRVTDVCVGITEQRLQAGKHALFIVTTPSRVQQEGLMSLFQMENSLQRLQSPRFSTIGHRMAINPNPTRKMIEQDDGRISTLGSRLQLKV